MATEVATVIYNMAQQQVIDERNAAMKRNDVMLRVYLEFELDAGDNGLEYDEDHEMELMFFFTKDHTNQLYYSGHGHAGMDGDMRFWTKVTDMNKLYDLVYSHVETCSVFRSGVVVRYGTVEMKKILYDLYKHPLRPPLLRNIDFCMIQKCSVETIMNNIKTKLAFYMSCEMPM